ncbi:MAG: glycosyltransferase family 2 protein [Solirubrobacterales bacterium]|nr:glycosyltransferase family 2 protein [Solirubrobacterales bacterium]
MSKFFLLFFSICGAILGTTDNLLALSSGVAVPCYYKHFKYLPNLLTSLTHQTHLPDEVVISLSQVEHLAKEEIDGLEEGPWPFRVEIIRRIGIFMEGANRTAASRHCSSDIVLCIDADDIPHPQRVEAVLQMFEALPNAEMVLCGHAYCPGESIVCDSAIPFFSPTEYSQIRFELGSHTWLQLFCESNLKRWESGVHNGSPSLRRSLLERGYDWSDLKNGADIEFNSRVIRENHATYMIQLPLLHYFNGRSSGIDVGR